MTRNTLFFIISVSVLAIMSMPGALYARSDKPMFKVEAKAAVLVNAVSGQIIYEQNSDLPIPPASLTKLMTLNLVLDAVDESYLSLDDEVRISKKAWKTKGSRMFLDVGKTAALETMIKGIAVVSANDACVAVSEHLAGVEEVFADRMNEKAGLIGMKNTVFKNSHGLPADGQMTTARDMALLSAYYLKNHPDVLKYHSIKKMTYNNITQSNRNGLLWLDYGVDGLKTGWFSDAGFHIIATAQKDGDRFIAVVMGSSSERARENSALKLLNFGFRNYKTVEVITAGRPMADVSVWKGKKGDLALGIQKNAFITVPREATGEVQIQKQYPDKIFAPVQKGQQIGSVRVLVNDRKMSEYDLVALEPVDKAGFFKLILHQFFLLMILPPYWGGILLLALIILVLVSIKSAMKMRGKDELSGLR